ncbi:hypothetical protein Goarm_010159 [Gossypium armourianum]|uniref:Uncharacterized protein n=1 Tax=Gossypium armourianum TaxID=34283 RepID=A0A7J9JV62_9ROSI|nr:hypothetical protein [Gossypium armourianum]
MSSPMILKNPNSLQRRQPLLHSRSNSVDSCITPRGNTNLRFGEKRLRKLHKKGLLQPKNHGAHFRCNDPELLCLEDYFQDAGVSEETEKAAVELENEMWQRFYGTGFWRSPSQKEGETPRFHPL